MRRDVLVFGTTLVSMYDVCQYGRTIPSPQGETMAYHQEEKIDLNEFGEEVQYISLMQARLLAIRHAQENSEIYPAKYSGVRLVWELISTDEDDDYYHIKLSWRPSGRFEGKPGVEEFFIDKTGSIELRQLLDEPSLPDDLEITQETSSVIEHPTAQTPTKINNHPRSRATQYVAPGSKIVSLPIMRELSGLIGDVLDFGTKMTTGKAMVATITQLGWTLRIFSPSVGVRSVSLMWSTNIDRGTIRVPAADKLRRCLPEATIPIDEFRDIMRGIGVDIETISGLQSLAVAENHMIEVLDQLAPVIRQLATFYGE